MRPARRWWPLMVAVAVICVLWGRGRGDGRSLRCEHARGRAGPALGSSSTTARTVCAATRRAGAGGNGKGLPSESALRGADAITVCGRMDGMGSQYLSRVGGLALARRHAKRYLHTPQVASQLHDSTEPDQPDDNFLGLRSDPVPPSSRLLTAKDPLYYERDLTPWLSQAVRAELAGAYWATPKPALRPCPHGWAIHIRRGDLYGDTTHGQGFKVGRRVPLAFYEGLVRQLLATAAVTDETIGIYSDEPDSAVFGRLLALPGASRMRLELNTTTHESFHAFVTARRLVVANSALSYSAGVLRVAPGRQTFHTAQGEFTHDPLPDWRSTETLLS